MVRSLKEMKSVLYDQKWYKQAKNFNVYYVWRGVKWEGDLRYDITIIPPKMLGQEFPKTKGHKHLNNFQELITVLEGQAFYLAQWGKGNKIDKIEVIKAKKGDWIIYPPNCDHLTINSGKENLIMANWLSKKCKSDYSLFERYQGAGYYYTKQGWIKNQNYKSVPKLKFKKPLKRKPKSLDFLYGPQPTHHPTRKNHR
ncbi:MAG: glucose-6-phosphate isomerase family protein [Patescibacteria group bacterium]|nr:glucose-6-phosphate isomerase family protein [Patescibacteria group bacterium]